MKGGGKKITHKARRRCDRVSGVSLPWPICPSRVGGGEGAAESGTRAPPDSDLGSSLADGPVEVAAATVLIAGEV